MTEAVISPYDRVQESFRKTAESLAAMEEVIKFTSADKAARAMARDLCGYDPSRNYGGNPFDGTWGYHGGPESVVITVSIDNVITYTRTAANSPQGRVLFRLVMDVTQGVIEEAEGAPRLPDIRAVAAGLLALSKVAACD